MKVLIFTTLILFATVTLRAQEEVYKPARYYDKKGTRVDGYFNEKGSTLKTILFKKNLQGESAEVKIKTLTAFRNRTTGPRL